MSFKTDFYSQLSGYTGLTSLVGTRIYLPKKVPQDVAWPFCTYSVVNRERQYSHQGFSGIEQYRVRVRIFAKDVESGSTSSAQVDAISEQVIAAMEVWRAAHYKIQACRHDGEADMEEDTEFDFDQLPIYFMVKYAP